MPPSTSRPIRSTSYSPNMTLASIFYVLFVIQALPYSCQQDEDIPHNEVRNWALKFGVDLWEFGKQFTKINEIQQKYNSHAAEVSRKDGLILIREMANEVKNMIDKNKNAIMRIMEYAEHAALSHRIDPEKTNLKYINSKTLGKKQNANLEMNRHFDQRYVNVTRSSVIIPKFLNENEPAVVNALSWSENLDSVFVNNYEVVPELSWQFFGSSTGFIRKFPATQWPPEDQKNRNDMHDFRSSSWYVGASTSPKDLAILIDNSNTLNSKAFDLAKSTVKAIINTVGDDDFINVYAFAETTKEIVTCFKDVMVQGTSVNKRELIYAVDNLMMESGSNFSAALVTGFEILQKYNKSGEGSQCNQALMLVTGSAKGDYGHLIKGYNQPHTPVRIFTYNVVKDSSNAGHLYSMACGNKGYYEYIQSKDEIKEKVLNYLRVMSRPMVMYQNKHPIHWTPVYTGGKANSLSPNRVEEGQLMTTLSTPIFDRRNTSVRSANLLGVVGTDIPIQQIKKLIPPYKLGANGYSFIVNNNGHVLYHPDLRPLYSDNLKPIYNSVDLSSVEMLDSMANPYENNTLLSDLRQDMINQKEGETEIKVKIHYDDMKRVSTRKNKYFYHPIHGTPFSLGISLPDGYGMYEVLAEQEIKLSQIDVLEYFKGNNWRVHPDWIYCEYNYANEHTFQSPEEQLLHFLGKIKQPGWKWMSLRPRSILKQYGGGIPSMKKVEKDSYYCDKSLMQSLVFDAMVTDGFGKFNPSSVKEQQGYQMFGQTLTFIATRSGLFRWQDHTSKHQYEKYFADMNQNSIDEAWYKRAVDHHNIEPESFVFSVPFESGTSQSTFVTATHAVFLEHKGHKAPAAVVGLQFQHSTLAAHFLNITSGCTGNSGCKKTCASEDLDCYVLDNNGFIIISEKSEHTGKFFGYADGTIMDSLVQDGVYKKVPIVDFQGACTDSKSRYSSADKLNLDTLKHLMWLFNWAFSKFIWLCARLQLHVLLNVHYIVAQEDIDGPIYSDYESSNIDYGEGLEIKRVEPTSRGSESDDKKSDPQPGNKDPSRAILEETNYRASGQTGSLRTSHARHCTKTVDLYVLQPSRLNNSGNFNPLKGKLTNCHITGCERPFSVQKIPHSNLILLVVDTLCPCGSKQLSISAQEIVPEEVGNVCRGDLSLYRSRDITDPKCINYHPEEIMIKQCGGSSTIQPILALLFFTLFTIFHFS